jgi:hypothetical protein
MMKFILLVLGTAATIFNYQHLSAQSGYHYPVTLLPLLYAMGTVLLANLLHAGAHQEGRQPREAGDAVSLWRTPYDLDVPVSGQSWMFVHRDTCDGSSRGSMPHTCVTTHAKDHSDILP